MKTVSVNSSVDNSISLQKIIDQQGNTPTNFIFSEDNEIEINSRIRVFNFTEFTGNNCKFNLMENAPVSTFSSGIPLIAPKYPRASEGLCFHDIIFDGRRDTQNKVPLKNGKNWGLGYHNTFMLGDLGGVAYSNSKNCHFYNLSFYNSLGDGIRVEGSTNINIHDITASRGGHDVICLAGTDGARVYNLNIKTAVNAAVRTRSSKNIKIHDCKIEGTSIAYSPGIQIQATAENWVSSDIEIYNNEIKNVYGPGIQIVGSVKNTGLVSVHNNLIRNCGGMPAGTNTPTVGGIIFDGFPVDVRQNTIVDCRGYGIAAGNYNIVSPYSFNGTISRNIITGTKKANKAGTASGAGIANLISSRYKLSCSENEVWNNLTNYYKVSPDNCISVNPLFTSDYHLQDNSPCRFADYQLGCYEQEKPAFLMLECSENEIQMIKNIADSRAVFRSG